VRESFNFFILALCSLIRVFAFLLINIRGVAIKSLFCICTVSRYSFFSNLSLSNFMKRFKVFIDLYAILKLFFSVNNIKLVRDCIHIWYCEIFFYCDWWILLLTILFSYKFFLFANFLILLLIVEKIMSRG